MNFKILGVTFDDKLNWNCHVSGMCRKASSRLFALKQLHDFLPKRHLVLMYQNCVRNILEYAAPLLIGMNRSLEIDMERIQKRAHIIICGLHCRCSSFVPLSYRRNILSYKLFLSLISDPEHPLHHISLPVMPHSKKFRLPVVKTALRRKCFIISMSKLYNGGFTL